MAKDIMRALGRRVNQLRASRNWSQEQLSKASGLHRTYIVAIEHGERNLTLLTLHAIARAFRMKTSELVRGID